MQNKITPKAFHNSGLDGVRGLAICLVLFSHSVIFTQPSQITIIGTQAGYAGVAIFFVLSGYLITKLLLIEELETKSISLRFFYIRRALRLFPALWLYLLTLWILSFINGFPDVPWHSLVASLFYVRNLIGHGHETAHLWSLSIEEQFYILWPLFIILCRNNPTRLRISIILVVLISFWRYSAVTFQYASFGALHLRTDLRLDAPLAGCILALSEFAYPQLFSRLHSDSKISSFCLITGAVILTAQIGFGMETNLWLAFGPTATSIVGILLVLSQLGPGDRLQQLLTYQPLVKIGSISYGLYLWQQLFLGPEITGFVGVRSFPIGLILSFFVAILSYFFLEKPLLLLKTRFYSSANSTKSTA